MRSALWVPLFDELADPAAGRPARRRGRGGGAGTACSCGTTCAWRRAGARGRRPVDHRSPPRRHLTERVLLGPMVTPLARRRPAKVARETATLDRLSGGRLVLGVGLGSDRFGREFSAHRRRGGRPHAAARCSTRRWPSSTRPGRASRCSTAASTTWSTASRSCPGPCTAIPVWVAGFPGLRPGRWRRGRDPRRLLPGQPGAPRRAGRGGRRSGLRSDADRPSTSWSAPTGADVTAFAAAGATWWLTDFDPATLTVDEVRGVLRDGPA